MDRIKNWFELAATIGRRSFGFFYDRHRQDFYQVVNLACLEAAEAGLRKDVESERVQAIRIFRATFAQAARDYGFEIRKDRRGDIIGGWFFRRNVAPDSFEESWGRYSPEIGEGRAFSEPTEEQKTSWHRCGVELCAERGLYRDDWYGHLCRRHYNVVNVRRKRGWSDPYQNLATSGRVSPTYLPTRNREFWLIVRVGVTDEEWLAMWSWAFGYADDIEPRILEKARKKILN